MPVTMEQVREVLGAEEPDYEFAALLGSDALPHLSALISQEPAPGEGAKAAYLVGLLDHESVADVLGQAARSSDTLIRLAVAATLPNVQPQLRERLARTLVADAEVGVRKFTLEAVATSETAPVPDPGLTAVIHEQLTHETHPYLQQLARQITEHR